MGKTKIITVQEEMIKCRDELIKSREKICSEIDVRQRQLERFDRDIEFQNFGILCVENINKETNVNESYVKMAYDSLNKYVNEKGDDVGLVIDALGYLGQYFE